MKLFNIGIIEFKRLIKDKALVIIMFIVPIFVMTGTAFMMNKEPGKSTIIIVNEDKGIAGETFINQLIERDIARIKVKDREISEELIGKGYYAAAYIIPSDFSESIEKDKVPKIKLLKKENTNNILALNNEIFKSLKDFSISHKLSTNNLDSTLLKESYGVVKIATKDESAEVSHKDFLMIALLVNFAMYCSINVSTELIDLKRQKILTRNLATPNNSFHVLGGILMGLFIIQILSYSIIIFIQRNFLGLDASLSVAPYFINIISIIITSLCLGIMVSRFTDNSGMAALITNCFATGMGFLSGTFIPPELMPEVLTKFSKITPQYWAFKGIEEGRIFPNILIPLLFAAVFMTAGTFNFIGKKSVE